MPNGAIALADITSADWSLALDAPGEPGSGIGSVVEGTADVNQCVEIILTTPKGADPLRPTFGTDIWQYIDHPINTAIPAIVREVTAAITLWEPRVILLKVTARPIVDASAQGGAHMQIAATWRLKLAGGGFNPAAQQAAQTTSITIPSAKGFF